MIPPPHKPSNHSQYRNEYNKESDENGYTKDNIEDCILMVVVDLVRI